MTEARTPESDCWRFICAVYAVPGIADICLSLQQEHGADVPLLLFAGWLGARRGIALTGDDAAAARALAAPWQRDVVTRLRTLRSDLKTSPLMQRADVARLRESIKGNELAAERVEIALLVDWAQTRWPRPASGGDAAATAGNLRRVLSESQLSAAGVAAALGQIEAACLSYQQSI